MRVLQALHCCSGANGFQVADAEASHLDCWRLRLLLPNGTYKPGHTYALSEEATSEQQQLAALTGSEPGSQPVLMEGLFWNYFSVGADAQAAYNFHQLRDTHPQLAPNRAANKVWYSVFSCTSGGWSPPRLGGGLKGTHLKGEPYCACA